VTPPSPLRGRFAPSPTGPLHLGSLTTALASYLLAKSQQGQWLIRIEDLDPPREIMGMAKQQLQSLADFGLHPDEPPLYQSARAAYYDQALAQLLDSGKAFFCSCSRSQLLAQGGIHRQCVATHKATRTAIRLRAETGVVSFIDAVYGAQQQNLAVEVGDIVLKRADGYYAYQLAVVVDDAAQGINQVVRGADLLGSTPRQIFLQRQLDLPTPRYTHIGLVCNTEGQKLSKSQWAAALDTESRFHALHAAYQHLGQNTRVLQYNASASHNLAQALQYFDATQLPVLTIPEPDGTPDAH
jgi:glutamyl-Q tRNA(Asp) synthetase